MRVTVSRLAVLDTFRVVEFTNGIVRVSKLKTVLAELDVNPAATILVVVTVLLTTRFARFETWKTFSVPTLAVVAKTFVVERALDIYAFPVTCKFEVGFAPVRILTPVLVMRAYSAPAPKNV